MTHPHFEILRNFAQVHSLKPSHHYTAKILKRRFWELLFGIVIIMSGQKFLYTEQFLMPLWPITGVSLLMVFLRGYFMVLPIFMGCFLAGVTQGWPIKENFLIACCFSSFAAWCRWGSIKLIGAIQPVTKVSELSKWICLIMVSTIPLAYLIGCILGSNIWFSFEKTIRMSILASNGIFSLVPFGLMLDPFIVQTIISNKNLPALSIGFASIVMFLIGIFLNENYISFYLLSLCIMAPVYAFYFTQASSGLILLGYGAILIGLTPEQWQSHLMFPILFSFFCIITLISATLFHTRLLKN